MSDTDILARTIFGEARGGGKPLMSAVASTILNRVAKQKWYGLTITEVCKKHNDKGIYQYDCWDPKDPNCAVIEKADDTIPVFRDAQAIAAMAIAGHLPDMTGHATHYYSTYIPEPYWARDHTPSAAMGNMLFYNDIP